jgi:hypothetical protein
MSGLYACRRCGGMSPRRQFCPPCRVVRDREIKRARYWAARARGERVPTPAERGYDREHFELRKRVAVLVDAGAAVCARCGGRISPGSPWDLDHRDDDRSQYLGPSHRACNRATSGRRTARQDAARSVVSRVW